MSGVYRLSWYLKWPRRASRGRGFGIHSPFAFNFVTNVLRLPRRFGYYAYDEIAGLTARRRGDLRRREARLLFRLSLWAPGTRRVQMGGDEGVATHILRLPSQYHRVTVVSGVGQLPADTLFVMVEDTYAASVDALGAVLDAGGVVVVRHLHRGRGDADVLYSRLKTIMAHGMTFSNGSTAVCVGLRHLPRADYILNF